MTAGLEQAKTVESGTVIERNCSVSVVLPVLNEERDIGRLLGELLTQRSPRGGFEVLVADGGSTDATRAIVSEFARQSSAIKLVENPGRLSSGGGNAGANVASGTYVVFLDGHCELPRDDYLVRVYELFESTKADCLCRPQPLDRMGDGAWAKAISAARHSWLGHNPRSDIYGGEPGPADPSSAGAAYRSTCVRTLGGYDERFDACEDVEFNYRIAAAGYQSYRHPDLTVHYRPRSSLRSLFLQMIRYGRGRARLAARHPGAISWPLAGATGFIALGVVVMVTRGVSTGLLWYGIPTAIWNLVAAVEAIRLAGRTGNAARIFVALCVIPVGLLCGFGRGILDFPRFRVAPPSQGVS